LLAHDWGACRALDVLSGVCTAVKPASYAEEARHFRPARRSVALSSKRKLGVWPSTLVPPEHAPIFGTTAITQSTVQLSAGTMDRVISRARTDALIEARFYDVI